MGLCLARLATSYLAVASPFPRTRVRHVQGGWQVVVRSQNIASTSITVARRRLLEKDPAGLQSHQLDQVGKSIVEHTADIHGAIQGLGNIVQRVQLLD